jgi:hypothetical protein
MPHVTRPTPTDDHRGLSPNGDMASPKRAQIVTKLPDEDYRNYQGTGKLPALPVNIKQQLQIQAKKISKTKNFMQPHPRVTW